MKKPLIVGQAPSRSSDPRRAFSGKSGAKLAALVGDLSNFELTNLLDYWPGKNGKGDHFPRDEAKSNAAKIVRRFRDRRVLIVGVGVAKILKLDPKPLVWSRVCGATVGVLPHVSGICLWWNSKRNRRAAKTFLREIRRESLGLARRRRASSAAVRTGRDAPNVARKSRSGRSRLETRKSA